MADSSVRDDLHVPWGPGARMVPWTMGDFFWNWIFGHNWGSFFLVLYVLPLIIGAAIVINMCSTIIGICFFVGNIAY